ncbi:MAG: NAD(P)H-dependent oxidoreductase [Elusimicrobiota bacterium]
MIIIYAHPNREGHCGFFLSSLEEKLKKQDIGYELIDLYRDNFGPVLKPSEHYTSGHKEIAPEVLDIQKKIRDSEKLVFIYPTWWQNMPSILKGFIDRVFTPNFAYKYERKLPRGLLKGKKALILTSTGAPRILTKMTSADRSVKVMKKDVLKFCRIKAKAFVVDKALKLSDSQKSKIEMKVERGMKYLLK